NPSTTPLPTMICQFANSRQISLRCKNTRSPGSQHNSLKKIKPQTLILLVALYENTLSCVTQIKYSGFEQNLSCNPSIHYAEPWSAGNKTPGLRQFCRRKPRCRFTALPQKSQQPEIRPGRNKQTHPLPDSKRLLCP